MEVTIRVKKYKIDTEKIVQSMKDKKPQRIDKYSIAIDSCVFPIKQVISVTLGISPMEFGTSQAYQILQDLGFKIDTKAS